MVSFYGDSVIPFCGENFGGVSYGDSLSTCLSMRLENYYCFDLSGEDI